MKPQRLPNDLPNAAGPRWLVSFLVSCCLVGAASRFEERCLAQGEPSAAVPQDFRAAGVEQADWQDHLSWMRSPEFATFTNDIVTIAQHIAQNGASATNELQKLVEYLHSPHFFVRTTTAKYAGVVTFEPAKSMVRAHVEALLDDKISLVRMAAVHTLGKIGNENTIGKLERLQSDRPEVAALAKTAILELRQKGRAN
jgi:hypothetical protein